MTRRWWWTAALLLLVGCADVAETLATAPCGWSLRSDYTLPGGSCWTLDPPEGTAATDPGANACEAELGQGRRLWMPRQRLWVWTRLWTTGEPELVPVRAQCPGG